MTTSTIDALVIAERAGAHYLPAWETLEQARVPENKKAELERSISPYDTQGFLNYARNAKPLETKPFEIVGRVQLTPAAAQGSAGARARGVGAGVRPMPVARPVRSRISPDESRGRRGVPPKVLQTAPHQLRAWARSVPVPGSRAKLWGTPLHSLRSPLTPDGV